MRRIVKILIILFCCKSALIQAEEWFSKDLHIYVGTWVYKASNEEFKIVLKEGKYKGYFSYNCLLGGYYYKRENYVQDYLSIPYVEANHSTFDYIGIISSNSASDYSKINEQVLSLFFNDFRLKKSSACSRITILSPTSIRWQLFEDEGDYVEDMPPAGFSVPTDVILTKVQ